MALQVIDRAIQSFGAEGISQDQSLARSWAGLRTLRIADVRTVTFLNQQINSDSVVTGTRCGVLGYNLRNVTLLMAHVLYRFTSSKSEIES